MKILRLSLFNLKKNRREVAAVVFLTMVTVFMLSLCLTNSAKMQRAFDESFAASGSVNRIVLFNSSVYHEEFRRILEEEYAVERLTVNPFIFAGATDARDLSGEVVSYNFLFATARTERRIEGFVKTDALSDEAVAKLAHPIWLPENFRITKGYRPGDPFTVIKSGSEYPFTVAGFYVTGLESSDGYGFKCIINDEDYDLFSMLFAAESAFSYNGMGLCFDAADDFDVDGYIEKCGEASSENLVGSMQKLSYESEKRNEMTFADIFLLMTVSMSLITMVSALFLIRHKISNDIEDQMQQIGVLEALGYRAHEISLAYLYEYMISGGSGCLLGALLTCLITPAMNAFDESMLGRSVSGDIEIAGVFVVSLAVFAVVIAFALLKARTVKKYPPVIAFRRGILTHHFVRNILPLKNTGTHINARLAMKSLVTDLRSCIGVAVCMILSGVTILFAIISFDFFKDGTKGLEAMMGMDDTVMVTLMEGVDPEKIAEEIRTMPGVRKVLVGYAISNVAVKGSDMSGTVQVFRDYAEAERIKTTQGRFPEHDNEIMIGYRRAVQEGIAVGDRIVLNKGGLEKSYMVSGIVSSMLNGGSALYLTEDGYRRISINARPDMLHVYLEEGVDSDEFEETLEAAYGKSAKDAASAAGTGGDLTERIRAAADEKMAVMLSRYGVTSVDYAILIGDELITGNSRPFVIKETATWAGMVKTQMAPIANTFRTFTLLAALLIALIVGVILSIITGSYVRRQRHNLGIMKGLGYSSRDLMTQMALRILPVVVPSLIIASVLTVWINKLFWLGVGGVIAKADPAVMILTDLILVAFCYAVTYLGAGRIRKISVNELMTE